MYRATNTTARHQSIDGTIQPICAESAVKQEATNQPSQQCNSLAGEDITLMPGSHICHHAPPASVKLHLDFDILTSTTFRHTYTHTHTLVHCHQHQQHNKIHHISITTAAYCRTLNFHVMSCHFAVVALRWLAAAD